MWRNIQHRHSARGMWALREVWSEIHLQQELMCHVFIVSFQLCSRDFISLCFYLESLLLSFAQGAGCWLSPFPVYIKLLLAWCRVLVLHMLQSPGLVPRSAVPAHLQCGAVVFAVSCSLPGSTSSSPLCLTDAVEQLCLSLPLGRRQNESPALISLCLATAQTLKLPEMGRK